MELHISRRGTLIVTIMATIAFLAGAQSVRAADSSGKTVALAKPAATILVLSRGARESLTAINPSARLLEDRDGERADLVVCDPGRVGDIPASQKSVPVFNYDPRDFTGLADAIMALGTLAGDPSGGLKVAARLTSSVNGIHRILSTISKKNYPDVFVELCSDPLRTCGRASFLQSLISEAGGKNVFFDRNANVVTISLEEVAQRKPRYTVAQEPLALPGYAEGERILIDIDAATSPGPGVATILVKLAKAFHPGLIP